MSTPTPMPPPPVQVPPIPASTTASTLPAAPPPPPAVDPLPTALQVKVMAGMFVSGVIAVAIGFLVGSYGPVVQRGGVFLAVYAVLAAASWLPPSVLSRRVDATLERWVRGSATGFYGMMALATFVHLELITMIDAVASFELSTGAIKQALIQRVIGFSQESLMNFVWGFAWPGNLFQNRAGLAPFVLVGLAWGLFRVGARVLPHASFVGGKRDSKKKKKKKAGKE